MDDLLDGLFIGQSPLKTLQLKSSIAISVRRDRPSSGGMATINDQLFFLISSNNNIENLIFLFNPIA